MLDTIYISVSFAGKTKSSHKIKVRIGYRNDSRFVVEVCQGYVHYCYSLEMRFFRNARVVVCN